MSRNVPHQGNIYCARERRQARAEEPPTTSPGQPRYWKTSYPPRLIPAHLEAQKRLRERLPPALREQEEKSIDTRIPPDRLSRQRRRWAEAAKDRLIFALHPSGHNRHERKRIARNLQREDAVENRDVYEQRSPPVLPEHLDTLLDEDAGGEFS